MHMQRAGSILFLGGLLAFSGCQQSVKRAEPSRRSGERAHVRVARAPERFNPAPIINVQKVALNGKVVGYMKTRLETRYDKPIHLFLVYNNKFDVLGYITESGTTLRVERGELNDLGPRSRDDALRLLCGGTFGDEVSFSPMDRPRTIATE